MIKNKMKDLQLNSCCAGRSFNNLILSEYLTEN
jgi:hypothetical protein